MILKRLFVPSNCLQGNELPIHLLWKQEVVININIKIPRSFDIIRIYNADNAIILENGILHVSKFEENGFLGVVLKAQRLSEYARDENIVFEIIDSTGECEVITKNIHLFRPSIKIVSIPDQIVIKRDIDQNSCLTDKQIIISNEGEGIAIINFLESENSQLKIVEPDGIAEFSRNFWEDFSTILEKLKMRHTGHTILIDNLISLRTAMFHLDDTEIKRIIDIYTQFDDAYQKDPIFAKEITSSIITAYMKNIHLITEMESFVTYLKSIESNRIIVNNPIGVIKVGIMPKKFSSKLIIIDLGHNTYDPIPIELDLRAEQDCEIPIYKMLAMVSEEVKK